jgi:ParB/RepB/Spo0J family partition protein
MTPETITQIPLEQLHESPFNPRKTFVDIDELATNILAEGRIHQPLLVRPRLTNPLRDDLADGYEIVFGHRRYRAAERASLATVPCMVRAMTEAEARRAQIAENLARSDVHPIEEAEGFHALIEQGDTTADDLAVLVGKSRSYVYGRLKLLQACDEVRKSCLAGTIGSEVALLIARLRTDKLQAKALAAIRNDTSQAAKLDDGGARSYRHIRDLLAEKFTLSLKDALFARDDATLLPDAGTCSACPKRTANAPEFEDLASPQREGEHRHYHRPGGPDICTDPDCFDAKKVAHLKREADQLRAAGHEVVDGNKARASVGAYGDVKGGFIPLERVKDLLKKLPKKGSAAAQDIKPPPVVMIQNPRDGKVIKAVRQADLVAAGVAEKQAQPSINASLQARQAAQEREREKAKTQAQEETARRTALLMHVRQVASQRERDAFDLRLVAAAAFSGVGYNDKDFVAELQGIKPSKRGTIAEDLKRLIDLMTPAQLTALILDCALVDNVCVDQWETERQPGPLLALAHHYGINAKAVMAAAQGASTASPAGASAEEDNAPAAPAPGKTKKTKTSPAKAVEQVKDEAGSAGQRDLLAEASV